MRRTIAASLATLASVSPLGFAPAASAADSDSVWRTPSNRVWIYEWTNFKGRKKSYSGTDRQFWNDEWDGSNESVDNLTSSVDNVSYRNITLWQLGGSNGGACGGEAVWVGSWEWISNLGYEDFNNKASCITFS